MANKESNIIYNKHVEICEKYLTNAQFGKLMFALFRSDPDEIPDFKDDKLLGLAFEFLALQQEIDRAKYQKIVERNRKNGKLGGRPKKNPENPNGFFKNPNENDNDNDNENDDDNESVPDHSSINFFGSFNNVKLTDKERTQLTENYERSDELINKVSAWIKDAKGPVPDHYELCVKFAINESWPKRRVIEPVRPITVTDPLEPDEQKRKVAEMRKKLNGAIKSV